MCKTMKVTMLWMAGFLLLAHSVVPHMHHQSYSSLDSCEAESSSDLLDVLANVFHNDLGVEHLEHFQVQKNQAPSLTAIQLEVTLPVIFTEEVKEVEYSPFLETPPFDEPILIGYGLRGPPLV